MTLFGMLWRFATMFIGAWVAVAIAMVLFHLPQDIGLHLAALMAAAFGARFWFDFANQRTMSPRERWRAMAGMWGVSAVLQVVVTRLHFMREAVQAPDGAWGSSAWVASMAVMLVVDAGVIYIGLSMAQRQGEQSSLRRRGQAIPE
jgi:hypothetical protein